MKLCCVIYPDSETYRDSLVLKIVFTDMREKAPDPFLGEYFQWLAERLEERMQLNPRKPFFETHTAKKF